MNAKRTPTSGTRRTNDGKKPASKRSITRKLKIDQSVAKGSLGDDFWRIDITISNENRFQIAAMILRPVPPRPPITGIRVVEWFLAAMALPPVPPRPPITGSRVGE